MTLQNAEIGNAGDYAWQNRMQNPAMRKIMHGGMEGEI